MTEHMNFSDIEKSIAAVLGSMAQTRTKAYSGPFLTEKVNLTGTPETIVTEEMTIADVHTVEQILKVGNRGYAYLYRTFGSRPETFVFNMTPENIANFIGSHQFDCASIIITDLYDIRILDTFGGFLNRCNDIVLLEEIQRHLVPIQLREREPVTFSMVSVDIYDTYHMLLEGCMSDSELCNQLQASLTTHSQRTIKEKNGIDISQYPYISTQYIAGQKCIRHTIANDPENLAAYILAHAKDAGEISICSPDGIEVIIANSGYVLLCKDVRYMEDKLEPALARLRNTVELPAIHEVTITSNV